MQVAASRLDPDREQEILDAALQLLAEGGYESLRMEAIAANARASKATLYRRWRNKGELVVQALHRRRERVLPRHAPVDTGSLRGDMLVTMRIFVARMRSAEGRLMLALVHALNHDPDLAAAWNWDDFDQSREHQDEVFARAVARGEIPRHPDVDELRAVGRSIVFGQAWLNGGRLDDAFAERLVDAWLLPYLTHAPPRANAAWPASNDEETR